MANARVFDVFSLFRATLLVSGLSLAACAASVDGDMVGSDMNSAAGEDSGVDAGVMEEQPEPLDASVEVDVRDAGAPELVDAGRLRPACGDGERGDDEACDDGNTLPGDGCSGVCRVEPNFVCTDDGVCMSTIVCGDGMRQGGEACDDGNTVSGDGCAAGCDALETDPGCAEGSCVSDAVCGDGLITGRESCDDGDTMAADGCSDVCQLEPDFICSTPGLACVPIAVCGDGRRSGRETCDDGNQAGSDGCSADCSAVETDFACPIPGMACVSTVACGDRWVTGSEQCDDGNTLANDGCSEGCTLEPGWACPVVGLACQAATCGDGLRIGAEECEDGNALSGDGCSDRCRVESGFTCPTLGVPCRATRCGDGVVEGEEACDDGVNDRPYDGCFACQREPQCNNDGCRAVCGDGITFPSEACDDANTRSGDGCSSACEVEEGYACTLIEEAAPDAVDVPVIYRDFIGRGGAQGHPNFESRIGSERGIVGPLLGADKKPIYALTGLGSTTTTNATDFGQWFNDVPAMNRTLYDSLRLARQPNGDYVFFDPYFFPLDGRGFVAEGRESARQGVADETGNRFHNFHFTSELRYWFEYEGGEFLEFRGDDDVFVFMNGRLAVDLGGVHGAETGGVTLASGGDARFGLVPNGIYEVVVFQAERMTSESQYKLTLRGFSRAYSACESVCGDGIVSRDELCDDGINDGSYGGCAPDCQTFGPRCGDGVVSADQGEECDEVLNLGGYEGCTASCTFGPLCGDGMVDGLWGEPCDDGVNDGGYGECAPGCVPGERCGDGVVQASETCDSGINSGAYGTCAPGCVLGPRCGDGYVQGGAGEECDDGLNDGGYGQCAVGCVRGPRCGDGQRQASQGEECDDGANDGGYGECAPGCSLGPRCGDGQRQAAAGEQCDDGVNDGGYGECSPGCVLGPRCGDGVVQPGEDCDDANTNDNDGCDRACRAVIVL